jgi:hypothetical protein
VKSKAILIGTMAILAIFVGTSAFSNSAYAATIDVACAAAPGQNAAPSEGTTLVYAIINNNFIDFTEVVADDIFGNIRGWDPDGMTTFFTVEGVPSDANINSVIAVSTNDLHGLAVCGVNLVIPEGLEANITESMNMTASK